MSPDKFIKTIQEELVDYFDEKEIKSPSISIINNSIVLESNIINLNVFNDIVILVFGICILVSWYAQYGLFAILVIVISCFFLWADFDSINKVIIDFDTRIISINSKNLFKKIINKSQQNIYFKDIANVFIYYPTTTPGLKRYKLMLENKDEEKITCIDFTYSKQAEGFLPFLKKIIHP